MQQAFDLVRQQLGTEATVLHTREVNSNWVSRLLRGREYEIAASVDLAPPQPPVEQELQLDYRSRYRDDFQRQDQQAEELHVLAENLRRQRVAKPLQEMPQALFQAYTDLIEADVEEQMARQMIEQLSQQEQLDMTSPLAVQAELMRLLEADLQVDGPLKVVSGQRRIVALVGPTGVGKTTTIAKLAANYRLRESKRVGLITVDTYRIAAVEQLRTYADIIDLPMEVVSTPREMREAVGRMKDLDLVLMDTAGRSPRDEVKLQELKSMLGEANPDEVHLVLSAVSGSRTLASIAQRFAAVGTTAMIVTKLDEATGLGNLLSLLRTAKLPVSYLTDGQNVPDDIQVARSQGFARMILGNHQHTVERDRMAFTQMRGEARGASR